MHLNDSSLFCVLVSLDVYSFDRCYLIHLAYMFREKTFQLTLPGNSYRIFIEGLKSPVTKAAYSFALQKYMKHLNIDNPDDLLIHQGNPKIIQSNY